MLKTTLTERGILELGPIVTVNSFQEFGILNIQPQRQSLKELKYFIHAPQEENPRVTRIVINNDKDILLATHGMNQRGTDSVHVD
jgi:hypothetical protein